MTTWAAPTAGNLTGPITSVGLATSVASQTGTGTTFVMNTSPTLVTPDLGTPSAGVATNLTGTAAGLTAGNATLAATVTTNADLTGPITSTGNATAIGAQTGTGTTFVMQDTPTLTTPEIGAATGTSLAFAGGTSGLVTVQPAAVAGAWSMTLPTSGGSSGQFLSTDGAGVTTWAAPTAGNLTGPITSLGGVTSVASQSGTGSTFVMDTLPQMTGMGIGAAASTGNLEMAAGGQWLPDADSTTALGIADAGGTSFVTFDSANRRVGLGLTPDVQFQTFQSSGFGSYTAQYAGAFTLPTATAMVSTLTAASTLHQTSGIEVFQELSGSPVQFSYGFNAAAVIGTNDTATYPAGVLSAGNYLSRYDGSGSHPRLRGGAFQATRGGTGNVTELTAIYANSRQESGATSGTVTALNHFFADTPVGVAGMTFTNIYGLYVASMTPVAGTVTNTPYGIYQAGTADQNYFASSVGIGTETPSAELDVVGSILTTDIQVGASGYITSDGSTGLTNTFTFGGGATGDVATMTFKDGILTAVTTVP